MGLLGIDTSADSVYYVTHWANGPLDEEAAWADVRAAIASGNQAYVVCPLIEESEKIEVASAEETYERLSHGDLAGFRLGLLHGRLTSVEKETIMARFRSGDLDVLVATTVIEVGVDVANATVMVILEPTASASRNCTNCGAASAVAPRCRGAGS
jgi:ATP-dependent DNA helicase RecG